MKWSQQLENYLANAKVILASVEDFSDHSHFRSYLSHYKGDLGHKQTDVSQFKGYLSHYKVIWATQKVITATF